MACPRKQQNNNDKTTTTKQQQRNNHVSHTIATVGLSTCQPIHLLSNLHPYLQGIGGRDLFKSHGVMHGGVAAVVFHFYQPQHVIFLVVPPSATPPFPRRLPRDQHPHQPDRPFHGRDHQRCHAVDVGPRPGAPSANQQRTDLPVPVHGRVQFVLNAAFLAVCPSVFLFRQVEGQLGLFVPFASPSRHQMQTGQPSRCREITQTHRHPWAHGVGGGRGGILLKQPRGTALEISKI